MAKNMSPKYSTFNFGQFSSGNPPIYSLKIWYFFALNSSGDRIHLTLRVAFVIAEPRLKCVMISMNIISMKAL